MYLPEHSLLFFSKQSLTQLSLHLLNLFWMICLIFYHGFHAFTNQIKQKHKKNNENAISILLDFPKLSPA